MALVAGTAIAKITLITLACYSNDLAVLGYFTNSMRVESDDIPILHPG